MLVDCISVFWSSNLGVRIHFLKRISEMSGVRTPTPAYNNTCSYQLRFLSTKLCSRGRFGGVFKFIQVVLV